MTTNNLDKLQSIRTELLSHPIYKEIRTPERVKVFMKHHIFAVWDFMSLLKRLQRSVTGVEIPWFSHEKPLFLASSMRLLSLKNQILMEGMGILVTFRYI